MTLYNALLIDISTNSESFLRCTFCQNRDKFFINIPTNYFTEIFEGQYYNVDFDILCDNFGNQFSFNFINPAKDSSHE